MSQPNTCRANLLETAKKVIIFKNLRKEILIDACPEPYFPDMS
jgi:hypothetical protein